MITIQQLFDYEKQTRPIFDEFYKSNGYSCKRIYGEANKDYDCLVKIDGKEWKVEEKFRSQEYPDLLVEIIQDEETNAPGWLYTTKAEILLYGVKDKIYAVNIEKLRNFVKKFGDNFNRQVSKKGWGITKNIIIPWTTIFRNKIGKIVKYR